MRLVCCVPFCKRTAGPRKGWPELFEGMEWICAEHWQAIPRKRRQAYTRRQQWAAGLTYRRRFPPHGVDLIEPKHRLWEVMKRDAIERALIGKGKPNGRQDRDRMD